MTSRETSTANRHWVALGLLILCVGAFVFEGWERQPQIDDAYISYRYARNLVEGHGLVFNIGERVEGYTNLLWTLLVAAGLALGGKAPEVGHFLGLVSGIAALLATYAYASAGVPPRLRWIAALAPPLLLYSVGFSAWAFSGLETPLFTALVAVTLAADARQKLGLAVLAAAAATLTRPNGLVLAAVILSFAFLRGPAQRRPRVVLIGGAYVLLLLGLTAFRILYYGAPLPNTFYAKVGGLPWSMGLGYLHVVLLGGSLPLLAPAVWLATRDRASRVGLCWAALTAFYIVSVGGDAFPGNRFWVPVMPLLAALATRALILQRQHQVGFRRELPFWIFLIAAPLWTLVSPGISVALLAALALATLGGTWGAKPRWAVAGALLVATAVFTVPLPASSRAGAMRPMFVNYYSNFLFSTRLRQEVLRDHLKGRHFLEILMGNSARRFLARKEDGAPVNLIAALAIGKLGYDSRLPILDLLGLTDAHIARSPPAPTHEGTLIVGHSRTDADYVFARNPDYIFIPKKGSPGMTLAASRAIWDHPELERRYEWDPAVKAYRLRQ